MSGASGPSRAHAVTSRQVAAWPRGAGRRMRERGEADLAAGDAQRELAPAGTPRAGEGRPGPRAGPAGRRHAVGAARRHVPVHERAGVVRAPRGPPATSATAPGTGRDQIPRCGVRGGRWKSVPGSSAPSAALRQTTAPPGRARRLVLGRAARHRGADGHEAAALEL